jgi:hypothetical protein
VRQLFERLATGESRDELFADAASGARAVLDPQVAGGGETQFELLHGLFWFLVNVADRGPLVAIVDDLHWADPGSVAFVGYAARRIEELPVLLVVTAREAEDGDYRRVVAELAADPAVTVLRPGPLSEAAVARLVRDRLGSEIPDELCAWVARPSRSAPILVAAGLAELDEDAAARAADRLVRGGFFEPTEELSFVHPIVRAAVYDERASRAAAGMTS